MKKAYDLAVKVATTNQGKAIWKGIGAVMENEKGMFILLDKTFNPAGVQDGKERLLVSMFRPKDYQQQPVNENDFGLPPQFADDDAVPF
jgi:hypothetical protein